MRSGKKILKKATGNSKRRKKAEVRSQKSEVEEKRFTLVFVLRRKKKDRSFFRDFVLRGCDVSG